MHNWNDYLIANDNGAFINYFSVLFGFKLYTLIFLTSSGFLWTNQFPCRFLIVVTRMNLKKLLSKIIKIKITDRFERKYRHFRITFLIELKCSKIITFPYRVVDFLRDISRQKGNILYKVMLFFDWF